jgi:transaldolase
LNWQSRTCGRPPISSPDPRSDRWCGRLGVAGGLATAGPRYGGTLAAAKALHARAERPNLFIKIPGTSEGLPAIEEAIFAGVPVNVTLLFSGEQYIAAAEAYLRGIERRIAAGLNPDVGSVASLFVSRWDVAVADKVPEALRNQLGIAIAGDAYVSDTATLLDSPRWLRILNEGARSQRLLWASTGTKDPNASDILYVQNLALPFTVNTMPEATLKALAVMKNSAKLYLQTQARNWQNSPRPVLTQTPWPHSCSKKGCLRSPSPGTICWIA